MVLARKKNCQRVLAVGLRVVSAMTGNPPLVGIGLLTDYGAVLKNIRTSLLMHEQKCKVGYC